MTATPETPKRPDPRPFGIANYRSFDETGFWLNEIRQINVLIGKNNCGKSNILHAIDSLNKSSHVSDASAFDPLRDNHRTSNKPPSAIIRMKLTDITIEGRAFEILKSAKIDEFALRWSLRDNTLENEHPFASLSISQLEIITLELCNARFQRVSGTAPFLKETAVHLVNRGRVLLKGFRNVIYIPNFREIRVGEREDITTGHNVIPMLHDMQHPDRGQENKRVDFERIESFVRDLLPDKNLRLEVPPQKDKIIVNMHGNRMPLSSFGTGIHQLVILCCNLALKDGCIVCIEEPEIHMHPDLQRKFIRFLKTTNNTYFITTHSNVFMDFLDDATIYHVTYDGVKSTVKRLEADSHARAVLTDMGYKASDLLQANGIIWVEGPSDRIYLNKWISLKDPTLIEGVHYAIAFYGGKVLAHFTASDDPVGEFVRILKINRNAICVIDRDGNDESAVLSEHKARVHDEMQDGFCWITDGREIENYLRPELVTEYLEKAVGHKVKFNFGVNDKLEKQVKTALKTDDKKIDYAREKPAYARRFVESMTIADLDAPNLRSNVERLVTEIRKWNNLPE